MVQEARLAVAPKRQLWPALRVIVVLALVLSLPILFVLRFRSRSRAPTGIAVLPLDNLSGDASQNYFADGMTDELITDLAQISALRVISRTSVMVYKGARKPLPQIARELNVDAVVEGTVLRSGDQVRITAQLIEAATDKHLWSQSYEGDLRNTLALQNRAASAIADQIRINLTPREQAALKNVKVVNPQAYESYLKGRLPDALKSLEELRTAFIHDKKTTFKKDGCPLDADTITHYEQVTRAFLDTIQRKMPSQVTKQDLKDWIASQRLRVGHRTVCNLSVSVVCFLHFCGVDHKKLLPQSERPTPWRRRPNVMTRVR
jgi:TolB-like protein